VVQYPRPWHDRVMKKALVTIQMLRGANGADMFMTHTRIAGQEQPAGLWSMDLEATEGATATWLTGRGGLGFRPDEVEWAYRPKHPLAMQLYTPPGQRSA
jgi:hypothetical protein